MLNLTSLTTQNYSWESTNSFTTLFDVDRIKVAAAIYLGIIQDIFNSTQPNLTSSIPTQFTNNSLVVVIPQDAPLPSTSHITVAPLLKEFASFAKQSFQNTFLNTNPESKQLLLSSNDTSSRTLLETISDTAVLAYNAFPASVQETLDSYNPKSLLPSCANDSDVFSYDSLYNCTLQGAIHLKDLGVQKTTDFLVSHATVEKVTSFVKNSLFETFWEIYNLGPIKQPMESLVSKKLLAGGAAILVAKIYFSRKSNEPKPSYLQIVSKTTSVALGVLGFSIVNYALPKEIPLEARLSTSLITVGAINLGSVLVGELAQKIYHRSKNTAELFSQIISIAGRVAIIGYLDHLTQKDPVLNNIVFLGSTGVALATYFTGFPTMAEVAKGTAIGPLKNCKKRKRKKLNW